MSFNFNLTIEIYQFFISYQCAIDHKQPAVSPTNSNFVNSYSFTLFVGFDFTQRLLVRVVNVTSDTGGWKVAGLRYMNWVIQSKAIIQTQFQRFRFICIIRIRTMKTLKNLIHYTIYSYTIKTKFSDLY